MARNKNTFTPQQMAALNSYLRGLDKKEGGGFTFGEEDYIKDIPFNTAEIAGADERYNYNAMGNALGGVDINAFTGAPQGNYGYDMSPDINESGVPYQAPDVRAPYRGELSTGQSYTPKDEMAIDDIPFDTQQVAEGLNKDNAADIKPKSTSTSTGFGSLAGAIVDPILQATTYANLQERLDADLSRVREGRDEAARLTQDPRIMMSGNQSANYGNLAEQGGYLDQMANGGQMNPGNSAEGMVNNYDGMQSHQGPQGGVPVDNAGRPSFVSGQQPVARTEGGEVSFNFPDKGNYVFSDKLRATKNGPTFAAQAKKIISRYKNRLGENFEHDDKLAIEALTQELSEVADSNEVTRALNPEDNNQGLPMREGGGGESSSSSSGGSSVGYEQIASWGADLIGGFTQNIDQYHAMKAQGAAQASGVVGQTDQLNSMMQQNPSFGYYPADMLAEQGGYLPKKENGGSVDYTSLSPMDKSAFLKNKGYEVGTISGKDSDFGKRSKAAEKHYLDNLMGKVPYEALSPSQKSMHLRDMGYDVGRISGKDSDFGTKSKKAEKAYLKAINSPSKEQRSSNINKVKDITDTKSINEASVFSNALESMGDAIGSVPRELMQNIVPSSLRAYGQYFGNALAQGTGLVGEDESIFQVTEDDLGIAEKKAMKNVLRRSLKYNRPGVADYRSYSNDPAVANAKSSDAALQALKKKGKGLLFPPMAYAQGSKSPYSESLSMLTGNTNYGIDENGDVIVTDYYDFNPSQRNEDLETGATLGGLKDTYNQLEEDYPDKNWWYKAHRAGEKVKSSIPTTINLGQAGDIFSEEEIANVPQYEPSRAGSAKYISPTDAIGRKVKEMLPFERGGYLPQKQNGGGEYEIEPTWFDRMTDREDVRYQKFQMPEWMPEFMQQGSDAMPTWLQKGLGMAPNSLQQMAAVAGKKGLGAAEAMWEAGVPWLVGDWLGGVDPYRDNAGYWANNEYNMNKIIPGTDEWSEDFHKTMDSPAFNLAESALNIAAMYVGGKGVTAAQQKILNKFFKGSTPVMRDAMIKKLGSRGVSNPGRVFDELKLEATGETSPINKTATLSTTRGRVPGYGDTPAATRPGVRGTTRGRVPEFDPANKYANLKNIDPLRLKPTEVWGQAARDPRGFGRKTIDSTLEGTKSFRGRLQNIHDTYRPFVSADLGEGDPALRTNPYDDSERATDPTKQIQTDIVDETGGGGDDGAGDAAVTDSTGGSMYAQDPFRSNNNLGAYSSGIYNTLRGLIDKPMTMDPGNYMIPSNYQAPTYRADEQIKALKDTEYNMMRATAPNTPTANIGQRYAGNVQFRKGLAQVLEQTRNRNERAKAQADRQNMAIDARNVGTRMNIEARNQMARAAKDNMVATGVGQISEASAMNQRDKATREMIHKMYAPISKVQTGEDGQPLLDEKGNYIPYIAPEGTGSSVSDLDTSEGVTTGDDAIVQENAAEGVVDRSIIDETPDIVTSSGFAPDFSTVNVDYNSKGYNKPQLHANVKVATDSGYRINNPGNLRPVGGTGFREFETLEDGWNALLGDLNAKRAGSPVAPLGTNVRDTLIKYNSYADGNTPEKYSKDITDATGIDPNRKFSDMSDDEIRQIMKELIKIESGNSYEALYGEKGEKV